jgi:hypothetical protein
MELTPSDTRFRDAVVEELRRNVRRPTVTWMGFDNLIQVTIQCDLFDRPAKIIKLGLKEHICYKAVLWVRRSAMSKMRGTVVLLGSNEVFALTLDTRSGEYDWEPPDRFDQIIVSEFDRWEEEGA